MAEIDKMNGALRMWRIWFLTEDNKLRALTNNHTWHRGVNECIGPMDMNYSSGGFYGFDSLSRIETQEPGFLQSWKEGQPGGRYNEQYQVLIGSMLGFGYCLIAPMGARVKLAQPEYLILSGNMDYDIRLQQTAVEYGMKPITWDQALTLKTGLVPFHKGMIIENNPSS